MRDETVLAVGAAALVGFLAMVVWLVYELRKGNVEGAAALFGTWIALSIGTIVFILVAAFIVSFTMLFVFGEVGGAVGLIGTIIAVFLTPIVWAVVIHRRAHKKAAAAQ